MRTSTILVTTVTTLAAYADAATANVASVIATHGWQSPGRSDARGLCPMLNTLANHGYLSRDGKNIGMNDLIDGLGTALNYDEKLVRSLGSVVPAKGKFNLDQLSLYPDIVHDASLSRIDSELSGATSSLNDAIWKATKADLTQLASADTTIDYKAMVAARNKRILRDKLANQKFNLDPHHDKVAIDEAATLLGTLGQDFDNPSVPLELLATLYENERLPLDLGWSTPQTPITLEQVQRLSDTMAALGPTYGTT